MIDLERHLINTGARMAVRGGCWEERFLGRLGIRLGVLLMRVRLWLA